MIRRFLSVIAVKRKAFGALLFAVLAVDLLLYISCVGPLKSRMVEAQEAYKKARAQSLEEKPRSSTGEDTGEIRLVKEHIPSSDKLMDNIIELFNIVQQYGLSMDWVDYKQEILEPYRLLKNTVTITLKGKYRVLKAVLAEIQNSSRIFCIEELSLSGGSGNMDSVSLKLDIATYYR